VKPSEKQAKSGGVAVRREEPDNGSRSLGPTPMRRRTPPHVGHLTTRRPLARLELAAHLSRVDERYGYLGHWGAPPTRGDLSVGVGPGTPPPKPECGPATVEALDADRSWGPILEKCEATRPPDVRLTVPPQWKRDSPLPATLRRPADVVHEDDDPYSLLLTLVQVDGLKLKAQ